VTNARGVVDASSSEEAASSEEGPRRRSSSAASAAAAFAAETVSGDGFGKTGFAATATDAGARAAGGGVRGLRIFVFRLGSVYTTALCRYLSARRGVVAVDGGEERGSRRRPPFVTLFVAGDVVSRAAKPRRFTRGRRVAGGGDVDASVFSCFRD
jgi:hypothetical protein